MSRLSEDLTRELDSFGLMALGALSCADTLTALLAVPGEPAQTTRPNPSLLYAALGAVSLCRSLQRRLHEACPLPRAESSERATAPIHGLLR